MELNTTGKRVRYLREARGWTQADLAYRLRALGAAGSTTRVSRIENGGGEPTAEGARALALALGTSTDYLLLLSDSPTGGVPLAPTAGEASRVAA